MSERISRSWGREAGAESRPVRTMAFALVALVGLWGCGGEDGGAPGGGGDERASAGADVRELGSAIEAQSAALPGYLVLGEFVGHFDVSTGRARVEMLEGPKQQSAAVPGMDQSLRNNEEDTPVSGRVRFIQDSAGNGQTIGACETFWNTGWLLEGSSWRFWVPLAAQSTFLEELEGDALENRFCTNFMLTNDVGRPLSEVWIIVDGVTIPGVRARVESAPRVLPSQQEGEPGVTLEPNSVQGMFRYGSFEDGQSVLGQWYFYFGAAPVSDFRVRGRIVEIFRERCDEDGDFNGDGIDRSGCGLLPPEAACSMNQDCLSQDCDGGMPIDPETSGSGTLGVCQPSAVGGLCLADTDCMEGLTCNLSAPDALDRGECEGTSTIFTQISAGAMHACGRTASGHVYCWGFASEGRLGNGETTPNRSTPVQVLGAGGTGVLDEVVMVTAGGRHSCALREDGTIWCWGGRGGGALGDGSTTGISTAPVPVDQGSLLFTEVRAGLMWTCGRTTASHVYCWGAEESDPMYYRGQLGTGATNGSPLPQHVSGLSGVTALTLGQYHTCAIAGGVPYCWGWNPYNQSSTSGNTTLLSPEAGTGLTGQTGVGASFYTSFFHSGGTVNSMGGLGSTYGRSGPTSPPAAMGGADWDAAPLGGETFACGIRSGEVWCWGGNLDGQLGNGGEDNEALPVRAALYSSSIVEVTAGSRYACALDNDGSVWCWGQGTQGQLGHGATPATMRHPVRVALGSAPVPQLPGASCRVNEECLSGDCEDGFCEGELGGACTIDDECGDFVCGPGNLCTVTSYIGWGCFTGGSCDGVFVTAIGGSTDPGCGMQATDPCAQGVLGTALSAAATAGRSTVHLQGNFSLSATADLVSGVSLYGGYEDGFTTHSGERSTLSVDAPMGMRADGLTDAVLLKDLIIESATPALPGRPSMALFVRDSGTHLSLDNVRLLAARGSAGQAGTAGNHGMAGLPGQNGSEMHGSPGGGWGSPGGGGNGGAGGWSGNSYTPEDGENGNDGAEGAFPQATGGTGGSATFGGMASPGQPGNFGIHGAHGTHGFSSAYGYLSADGTWNTAGMFGGTGTEGNQGGGGGGGGGSQGVSGVTNGFGGGGGGAGGHGGQPGTGGQAGGASIALAVVNSTVDLSSVHLVAIGGGNGGAGGAGGNGGGGGNGGVGAPSPGGEFDGGNGGGGGNGGDGGCGGNGAAGHAVGIYAVPGTGASVNLLWDVSFSSDPPGTPGSNSCAANGNPGRQAMLVQEEAREPGLDCLFDFQCESSDCDPVSGQCS